MSGLREPPVDGYLTIRLGGDGGEGSDREIERVSVGAGGAHIGDGGGDLFAVLGVLDGDGSATVLRGLTEGSTPPGLVDGDDVVRVGVVLSTGTGVSTLVEVGSVSTSVDVTAGVTTGRGRRGRSSLLGRRGGGGSLGNGGFGGRSVGSGFSGRSSGGAVLGTIVNGRGGGGSGGGSSGRGVVTSVYGSGGGTVQRGRSDVRGRRSDLGVVGGALSRSVGQLLGGEQGVAAVLEEGGVVLVLAVQSEVSQVVGVVRLKVRGVVVAGLSSRCDWRSVDEGAGDGSKSEYGGEHFDVERVCVFWC